MSVVIIVIAAALVVLLIWRASPGAYHSAYHKAELRDLAFFDEHPDCTYEEAHQHRDRVNRRFGR